MMAHALASIPLLSALRRSLRAPKQNAQTDEWTCGCQVGLGQDDAQVVGEELVSAPWRDVAYATPTAGRSRSNPW